MLPIPSACVAKEDNMSQTRRGPFRLVTVNTAPERAKKLIGRMIEGLKDNYEIEYVANCSGSWYMCFEFPLY